MSDEDRINSLADRAFAGVGIGLVVGIALAMAIYAAGGWFDTYEHRACTTTSQQTAPGGSGALLIWGISSVPLCNHDSKRPTVPLLLAITTAVPPGLLFGLAGGLLWRER